MADCGEQPELNLAVASSEGSGNLSSVGPFFQRVDWFSFLITAAVALVVYLSTIAPEVTLENSGILSTSAEYGGVGHPPGFPIWTIYSWLFTRLLPFSNIAWRVAVGSAAAMALACGLVALMVSRGGVWLLETRLALTRWKTTEQVFLRVACG